MNSRALIELCDSVGLGKSWNWLVPGYARSTRQDSAVLDRPIPSKIVKNSVEWQRYGHTVEAGGHEALSLPAVCNLPFRWLVALPDKFAKSEYRLGPTKAM
jgi:hypothetical protein